MSSSMLLSHTHSQLQSNQYFIILSENLFISALYFFCVFLDFPFFPSQSLAAGLTSSQPVAKLRALPLWLSLQYLGHNGIVQKIKHATSLVCLS